jgi:hypothetical protein
MKTTKTVKSKASKEKSKPADPVAPAKAPMSVAARPPGVTGAAKSTPAAPAKASAPLSGLKREITTDLIAVRAYIIWEKQGRPQGNDLANWLLAESQLRDEIQQSFTA